MYPSTSRSYIIESNTRVLANATSPLNFTTKYILNDRSQFAMKSFQIIAIIGPTGIGKTKLGVVLSKFLNGEVISLDSLQVYNEGGIMTAKPTSEEMDGIEHHLIDYLGPDEEPTDFVHLAVAKLKAIHQKNKIPIFVGGSMSLTQPLLFHPFVRCQQLSVIILDSKLSALAWRLDARVDEMVGQGLIEELLTLCSLEQALLNGADFSRGVWKAIGYKELRPCFDVRPGSSEYSQLEAEGITNMKANTRSYAAAQLNWIWSSLVPALRDREVEFTVFTVGNASSKKAKSDMKGNIHPKFKAVKVKA
jgi:adenylate isopentenyltransferase (cytokinin synthase)